MAYDEDLANLLRELLSSEDGLSEQAMFGGLGFLVNGNMAIAASGQGGLLVRCDPAATDDLVSRPHAGRFEMRGRAMDGWLRVAPEGARSKRQVEPWVRVGTGYARSLPPKSKKKR